MSDPLQIAVVAARLRLLVMAARHDNGTLAKIPEADWLLIATDLSFLQPAAPAEGLREAQVLGLADRMDTDRDRELVRIAVRNATPAAPAEGHKHEWDYDQNEELYCMTCLPAAPAEDRWPLGPGWWHPQTCTNQHNDDGNCLDSDGCITGWREEFPIAAPAEGLRKAFEAMDGDLFWSHGGDCPLRYNVNRPDPCTCGVNAAQDALRAALEANHE